MGQMRDGHWTYFILQHWITELFGYEHTLLFKKKEGNSEIITLFESACVDMQQDK
jgi:hypothetical protein